MDLPVNVLHNVFMDRELVFLHGRHFPGCVAHVNKRFDYETLQLCTRGRVEVWYDQTRHQLGPGGVWPCYPGPRVRFHAAADSPLQASPLATGQGSADHQEPAWDHRYVAFVGPTASAWRAEGLLPDAPVTLEQEAMLELAEQFKTLHEFMRRSDRWGRLRAIHALEGMLLRLAEWQQSPGTSPPSWLTAVMDRLGDTEAEDPDYDTLAAAMGMSRPTLRRRFRDATGQALHEYRLTCKVAKARELLGETDEPIKAVAESLGYRDVFYFTRQFTQHAGVSPGAYRQSRQG